MTKRKQLTVENVIDTTKRARTDEKDRTELKELAKNLDSQVLEEALVKSIANGLEATDEELAMTLEILSRVLTEDIVISSIIKLAEKANLNAMIMLANADDFGDSEWILETALDKAKKGNLPQNIIDILSMAVRENEGDKWDMQALGSSPDEDAQVV